ncbi:MAG TPA: universal stress protein [Nitrospira sp.]|nr:universal stress protein [Nitrospira sp.]
MVVLAEEDDRMATETLRAVPSRIVLATDFTARCDRAQDRAVQLAILWNAGLTAVHALTDIPLTDDTAVRDAYRNAAQRNAANLREELACVEGLRYSVVVEEGAVDEVVLDVVRRERADVIVTGIARSGLLAQAFVGSSVTALARKSPVPVLVVKKKVLDTDERVVVATDMSEASKGALATALKWFSLRKLVLFHAFNPPYRGIVDDKAGYDEQFERTAVAETRDFLDNVAGADAATKFEIIARQGDPVRGLEVLSNEAATDLVVAGTHGRSGLMHALVGSVATRILESVASDVLVVPLSGRS